jgi:hypothetical protein
VLPLSAFATLFFIGVAILALAEAHHARVELEMKQQHATEAQVDDWRVLVVPLLQHLASAVIVAAVMGVTYEYFVHKHVIEDFDHLLEQHAHATEQALDAFRTTTTRDVFELLANIATHSARIPTLYEPARDDANEVVFATTPRFFERLVGSPNARTESVEVLRVWIESPLPKLQFLGSDFVGLLRLEELAPRMRELAAERQKEWRTSTDAERGCVLNYWWAASRCESPMYDSLLQRLIEWDDPFVRKWILFVARQMPDARLAHMVEAFLRSRRHPPEADVLRAAIDAIEALHHYGIDMRMIVRRNRKVFEDAGLWREACAAVAAVPAEVAFPRRRALQKAMQFLGIRKT